MTPVGTKISVAELEDHLSAWIDPKGTIFYVPECGHWALADLMETSCRVLEDSGWMHLSYGTSYIPEEAVTEPQLCVLAQIKMTRLPTVSKESWGCSVNNFLTLYERLVR